MNGKKHTFFIIRRGDKRLSEVITNQAKIGNIFSGISPLGFITFTKGEPSEHIYRVEDPDLPRDLQLYDSDMFEEIFRSKSYVVFRSKKPISKDLLKETISFEAWEYELETTWLSDKAKEGLLLQRKHGDTYYFRKSEPSDYLHRIDFQVVKNPQEYLDSFKNDEWTYICSCRNDHYFRKIGGEREKTSVKPQIKAIKKKIRFRWFIFIWLFTMLAVGGIFLTFGILTDPVDLISKILLFIAGAFFEMTAFIIFFSVLKGFFALRKKRILLKYRGE
ncbi:MAG: hypothetical protein A2Y17_10365 [Clostridiales bacterium GWF2_38_85]|nr:MAG: hypothetical protein A2Y17_10365 [Clostridiales bacterium GWF2_38_85]